MLGAAPFLDAALLTGTAWIEVDAHDRAALNRRRPASRAQVLSGEVEMDGQGEERQAIGPKAIARGYRLLCISIPRGEAVDIDQ